jgi:hypothetical protein
MRGQGGGALPWDVKPALVPSLQWAVVPYRGMWNPRVWIFCGELTVPTLLNLTRSKSFLPRHAYPISETSWHLGVYLWSIYYVRQWWDRFSTWVRAIRCVWAPVAMSHHDRRLRLPLPKASGRQMLIRYWRPPDVFGRWHGPCPVWREAGRADKWWNPACPHPS